MALTNQLNIICPVCDDNNVTSLMPVTDLSLTGDLF